MANWRSSEPYWRYSLIVARSNAGTIDIQKVGFLREASANETV